MIVVSPLEINILFLFGAILIWISPTHFGDKKIDIKSSIEHILNYWIIFFLAAKFPYWAIDFDDFVFENKMTARSARGTEPDSKI